MKVGNSYKGKKVLILGLGVNQGGLGVTKFFAKAGAEVWVTDLKNKKELKVSLDQLKEFTKIKYTLGQHRHQDIDWADLIIKNPALKPGNPYLEYAKKQGKQMETDCGIVLNYIKPNQLIGVTGTKGKSTTASLIYQALKAKYGNKVLFAGNIGKSVMDLIPVAKDDSLVVLELSSFQLEAFEAHKVAPRWSVVTNILPDHLNYYGTMAKYITAKQVIAKYQQDRDYLFIHQGDPIVDTPKFLQSVEPKIIRFSAADLPKNFIPNLPGEHNKNNIAAAVAVCKVLGVQPKNTLTAANKFKGVEFRLQLVKTWNKIKIYNDTAATGPDAGIQALKSLPGSIVIAGGVNKSLPYRDYAKELGNSAKAIYFLEGDATELMKQALGTRQKALVRGTYDSLEKLVKDVKKEAQPGDVVLFSPAAASFNLFQNEFDRGRQFNAAVNKIFS